MDLVLLGAPLTLKDDPGARQMWDSGHAFYWENPARVGSDLAAFVEDRLLMGESSHRRPARLPGVQLPPV